MFNHFRYLVFTSKHHDGFCNWPSTYTYGWNSQAIGANRNVLQELKDAFAIADPNFHFGLYYSLFEWFNPIYLKDKSTGMSTRLVEFEIVLIKELKKYLIIHS